MNTERDLRKEFKKHLQTPDWVFTPVESGGTVSGIPDTYWYNQSAQLSGWVELKCTGGWTVELRAHQIAWLTQATRAGVRCTIAVWQQGRDRGAGTDRSTLWLLDGARGRQWLEAGLPRTMDPADAGGVLGHWHGDPRKWAWGEVALLLTK